MEIVKNRRIMKGPRGSQNLNATTANQIQQQPILCILPSNESHPISVDSIKRGKAGRGHWARVRSAAKLFVLSVSTVTRVETEDKEVQTGKMGGLNGVPWIEDWHCCIHRLKHYRTLETLQRFFSLKGLSTGTNIIFVHFRTQNYCCDLYAVYYYFFIHKFEKHK